MSQSIRKLKADYHINLKFFVYFTGCGDTALAIDETSKKTSKPLTSLQIMMEKTKTCHDFVV